MKTKITKRAVDAARANGQPMFLWDTDTTGFGLKVTPAGKKVYILQYRANGRLRRYTIGSHGSPWTPDTARREASRLLGIVADGDDPADMKATLTAAPTLTETAASFLAEHADAKTKPRTAVEYRRLFDKIILPELGRRRVTDLARADIAKLHHSLRETPYQANRVLALMSKLFNWAERIGHVPDGFNPCRHVERFREGKRERFLSPDELAKLGTALAELEIEGKVSASAIAAIRLLVLTGARLTEILTLRWDQVDFERASIRLQDSKTGAKSIYLNPPALDVLVSIKREDDNPWVIRGQRKGAHMVNLEKPWRSVRKRAKLDNVRLHDLRHSFASVGAAAGLGLPIIGALLGHSQPATTDRYAHLSADPLHQAADAIGRRIAAAMKGDRNHASDVVDILQARP